MRILVFYALACTRANALDNGIGLTPPMGWRHWKAFYAHIDQKIMETTMDEMATEYPVDGVPTSLKDLGYIYAGLDDHWQNCTVICPNGTVVPSWKPRNGDYDYQCCHGADGKCVQGSTTLPWYDADGTPHVDNHRFPSMKGMTDHAHSLGLRAGWYFGNFQCAGAVTGQGFDMEKLAQGSVKAIKHYGFDSVKLDSGFSISQNLSLWAELLNATGRHVMIENCHQGGIGPGMDDPNNGRCTGLDMPSDCPFNFWRTTGDPYPSWGSFMSALNSLRKVVNPNYGPAKHSGSPEYNADPPLSRPGAWAYANTMTVGDGSLTKDENRVHFGSWCIISSPLILAYNLSDPVRRELVWDIITNKEAIQVNQIWDGHPGRQSLVNIGSNKAVEVWTKRAGEGRTAVFVLNTEDAKADAPPKAPVLTLAQCIAENEGQEWELLFDDNKEKAALKSVSTKSCLEIHGCNSKDKTTVDTSFGCKPLPKPDDSNPCDFNMAWSINSNGTITSALAGKCLESSAWGVHIMSCNSSSEAQAWEIVDAGVGKIKIRQAKGDRMCLAEAVLGNVTVTIELADLNITGETKVRDVWHKKDLPNAKGTFSTQVDHHASQFFVFSPLGVDWPIPFTVAPWMRQDVNEQVTVV